MLVQYQQLDENLDSAETLFEKSYSGHENHGAIPLRGEYVFFEREPHEEGMADTYLTYSRRFGFSIEGQRIVVVSLLDKETWDQQVDEDGLMPREEADQDDSSIGFRRTRN